MTNKFKKWFNLYGLMDDCRIDSYGAKRVAWRAYKKGYKDAMDKIKDQQNLEEDFAITLVGGNK